MDRSCNGQLYSKYSSLLQVGLIAARRTGRLRGTNVVKAKDKE